MKKLLTALLFLPLLFTACNKDDDEPGVFTLAGVRNVNMSSADSNQLTLSVTQVSGERQDVRLTFSGLPAGVTAVYNSEANSPDLSTTIGFTSDFTAAGGSHPVVVTAASAQYSIADTFDLQLPDSQYFTLGTGRFVPDIVGKILLADDQYYFQAYHGDSGNGLAFFFYGNKVPASTGLYRIVSSPASPGEIRATAFDGSGATFRATGTDNKYAAITVNNGKLSISIPTIQVQSNDGTVKTSTGCVISEN